MYKFSEKSALILYNMCGQNHVHSDRRTDGQTETDRQTDGHWIKKKIKNLPHLNEFQLFVYCLDQNWSLQNLMLIHQKKN